MTTDNKKLPGLIANLLQRLLLLMLMNIFIPLKFLTI